MELDLAQIQALAPDAGTIQRAQDLLHTYKWAALHVGDNAIWGEYKTGGDAPYLVAADLHNLALKCDCPVRKKPCKHGIALGILFVQKPTYFSEKNELPDWLAAWLEKRRTKNTEQKQTKTTPLQIDIPTTISANEERMAAMALGSLDVENWLNDILQQGIAQSCNRANPAWWQSIASRMAEAKMSGMEKRLRSIINSQNTDNLDITYIKNNLSEIYLLNKSLQNIEKIGEPLKTQVLYSLGISPKKEHILQHQGIEDDWLVIGKATGFNIDKAPFQRVWLYGLRSKKLGFLLEYQYIGTEFTFHHTPSKIINGALHYYPCSYFGRGIFQQHEAINVQYAAPSGFSNFAKMLNEYAHAMACNPWLHWGEHAFGVVLENVCIERKDQAFYLIDQANDHLLLAISSEKAWKILAQSGGKHICVFGEWDGTKLEALSCFDETGLLSLN